MKISDLDVRRLWIPGSLLIILGLLSTLPFYASTYSVILATSIFMYINLTVSWVIFSAPTRYISLAPAAFFGIGIYTSATFGMQLPLGLVILIGALLSSCLALLIGALTLRLKGIYFTVFTFGMVELIKNLLLWYEIKYTGTRGRFVILVDNQTIYHVMLIILVALLITAYLIRRSKYGLALWSIGECEEAAAHSGVNVNALKTITFAISASFMGATGAIMATRWTYVDPYIAFKAHYSFVVVLMAAFGGMGQLYGPVLGATFFAYLEEILITRFPYIYMLGFGLILLLVILFMPDGIAGVIDNWQEKREEKRKGQQHANP